MLLSFNKSSISSLTVPIYQSIGENSNISSQLAELHFASPIPYYVFISCGCESLGRALESLYQQSSEN